MDYTIHGVAEVDMTEPLSLSFSHLSNQVYFLYLTLSALSIDSSVPFFLDSIYKQYYMIFALPFHLLRSV